MSNSKELERLWRLQTKVNMLVSDGKRDASVVADALQKILDQSSLKFELYLFGKQRTGGSETGYTVEKSLRETGLIARCLSTDDEMVKGWVINPNTYPAEFKGKVIFLWKSAKGRGVNRRVPCLVWYHGEVVMVWHLHSHGLGGSNPAVLVS